MATRPLLTREAFDFDLRPTRPWNNCQIQPDFSFSTLEQKWAYAAFIPLDLIGNGTGYALIDCVVTKGAIGVAFVGRTMEFVGPEAIVPRCEQKQIRVVCDYIDEATGIVFRNVSDDGASHAQILGGTFHYRTGAA